MRVLKVNIPSFSSIMSAKVRMRWLCACSYYMHVCVPGKLQYNCVAVLLPFFLVF